MEDDVDVAPVYPHHSVPHYHGDKVRAFMVSSAVIMLVSETVWRALPLTLGWSMVAVVVYIVAAGITNPNVTWIHYVNTVLAGASIFLFGITALNEFQVAGLTFDPSFLVNELLALLGIITLYFATKTIRGIVLRDRQLKKYEGDE